MDLRHALYKRDDWRVGLVVLGSAIVVGVMVAEEGLERGNEGKARTMRSGRKGAPRRCGTRSRML